MFWRRPPPNGLAAAPDDPIGIPPLAAAPIDVIRRGQAANRLLHDETLAGVFTDLRADTYAKWLITGPREVEKREELYRIIQALELVRGKLISYRGVGQVREVEREQEKAA